MKSKRFRRHSKKQRTPNVLIYFLFALSLALNLTGAVHRPEIQIVEVPVEVEVPEVYESESLEIPTVQRTVTPNTYSAPATVSMQTRSVVPPPPTATPKESPKLEEVDLQREKDEYVEPETETPEEYVLQTDEASIIALSQMVWGEDRGGTQLSQAATVWCVLNRVDGVSGNTILGVVTAPSQFSGYNPSNPVTQSIRELVEDVLMRWEKEHAGETDVGRVLPKDYKWFHGDGRYNYFRNAYSGSYNIWDWSLPNPYQ